MSEASRSVRGYAIGEVARRVDLPVARVRSYVEAGLLEPSRGPDGELVFGAHDLALLRIARELTAARVPPRRVRRALARVRRELPRGRPLSSVEIAARGRSVVVRDGDELWEADSGQRMFDFTAAPDEAAAAPPALAAIGAATSEPSDEADEPSSPLPAPLAFPGRRRDAEDDRAAEGDRAAEDDGQGSAEEWYEQAGELEGSDPEAATEAYRRVLELDPDHADAHLDLGRLLHEATLLPEAEEHYRQALVQRPDDATARFNLGVVLEDLKRPEEAIAAYLEALEADPANADAHYNLAGLCRRNGDQAAALRHLKAYKRLTGR